MITRVRITAQGFANRWIRGNKSLISAKNRVKGFGTRFVRGNLSLFDGLLQKERHPFRPSPKASAPSAFKNGGDAYWGYGGGPKAGAVDSAMKKGGDAYWDWSSTERPSYRGSPKKEISFPKQLATKLIGPFMATIKTDIEFCKIVWGLIRK